MFQFGYTAAVEGFEVCWAWGILGVGVFPGVGSFSGRCGKLTGWDAIGETYGISLKRTPGLGVGEGPASWGWRSGFYKGLVRARETYLPRATEAGFPPTGRSFSGWLG
jgi:hypothetical protein